MKINYDNKVSKKLVDNKSIHKYYGLLANNIIQRLSLLIVANTLSDIPNIPPTR